MARVLHFFAAMILHVSLFGSKARAATVESVVPGAIALRRDLAMEFVKENIYIVGAMALLCLFDVNMFHFIPWKRSDFFRMSEGFPNMLVLKLCLAVKSVQSAISVTAELAYLFKYDTDSAYGYYTEALLVMNILVGISAVAIEVAMFCFRGSVLAETEEKEQEAAVEQSQNAIAEMDLSHFYDVPVMNNPMHSSVGLEETTTSIEYTNSSTERRGSMNFAAMLKNKAINLYKSRKSLLLENPIHSSVGLEETTTSIEYTNSSTERRGSMNFAAMLKNKTINLYKSRKSLLLSRKSLSLEMKDKDMDATKGSDVRSESALGTLDETRVLQNPMINDAEASEGNMMYSNADAHADADGGYHDEQELTHNSRRHAFLEYSLDNHDEVVMNYASEASEGNMMYSNADADADAHADADTDADTDADADAGYHDEQELTHNSRRHAFLEYSLDNHDEVVMNYASEASEGNMMYSNADADAHADAHADADAGYHDEQELTHNSRRHAFLEYSLDNQMR